MYKFVSILYLFSGFKLQFYHIYTCYRYRSFEHNKWWRHIL